MARVWGFTSDFVGIVLYSGIFSNIYSEFTKANFCANVCVFAKVSAVMASIKNIFGGELTAYTELLSESRDEAVSRMQQQATQLGANAIVNVRFATSSIAAGAAEIYVYGTAVSVE